MPPVAETTCLGSAESFGTLNFGGAALGHVARTRRLVRAADLILQHPGGTLPQKFRDRADLDGFYRWRRGTTVLVSNRGRDPAPARTLSSPTSSLRCNRGPASEVACPAVRGCHLPSRNERARTLSRGPAAMH